MQQIVPWQTPPPQHSESKSQKAAIFLQQMPAGQSVPLPPQQSDADRQEAPRSLQQALSRQTALSPQQSQSWPQAVCIGRQQVAVPPPHEPCSQEALTSQQLSVEQSTCSSAHSVWQNSSQPSPEVVFPSSHSSPSSTLPSPQQAESTLMTPEPCASLNPPTWIL